MDCSQQAASRESCEAAGSRIMSHSISVGAERRYVRDLVVSYSSYLFVLAISLSNTKVSSICPSEKNIMLKHI